jgi:hypothetical protein
MPERKATALLVECMLLQSSETLREDVKAGEVTRES